MWQDCFGREIKVGDILYYPVTLGSSGGLQARWGTVIERYETHPHNVVGWLKSRPCIKVRAVQNKKDVILSCPNNIFINLSASPINNLEEILRKH